MAVKPIEFTPTEADFLRDKEEREAYWRSQVQPIYGEGDHSNLLQAWRIDDMQYRPRPNWLIDNIVEEEGLTVFFAGDKLGKTAVLSSMLWSWCAGHDHFLDKQFAMHDPQDGSGRSVLYVLLEGTGTYYERYDAWRQFYTSPESTLDNFLVVTEPVVLFDPRSRVDKEETWPDSLQRLGNTVATMRPSILVIDTFSRATPGVDENSSQLGLVVGVLDQIRAAYGTATILVHHTPVDPKSKRPRGWGGLKAAASSYVWIEGDQGDSILTFGTGPHRNADFTSKVEFITKPFASQFVVTLPDKGSMLDDEMHQILVNLNDLGGWQARRDVQGDLADTTANRKLDKLVELGLADKDMQGNRWVYKALKTLEEL